MAGHLFAGGPRAPPGKSLSSSLAGYEVDKVDFLNLLNAQVTLFNYEIDVYRHITEFEKTLADLEAVIGQAITVR